MGCAGVVVLFFPKLFLRSILPGFQEVAIEILGVSLIFFGQIIRVSARGYKSEHSCDSHALIQGGPYQLVRNPMYLGIFLIGLGVVLVMFKYWAVTIFILVFIIRYILLIFKEEKNLRLMFPDTYPEYCRKVPRIIPSVPSLIKLRITDYLPLKMCWFQREIGSIFSLLLIVFLVECWKDISEEGILAYFRQFVWVALVIFLFAIFIILLSKWTDEKNENSTSKS